MTSANILKKYNSDKPLLKFESYEYPKTCYIYYNKFGNPQHFNLYDTMEGEKLAQKKYSIVFGIKAKKLPQELETMDFLSCRDGPGFVVHKRVVQKLNGLCPHDFQAFPVIIKNFYGEAQDENHNFYLINILKLVDGFDKSYLITGPNEFPRFSKRVINANCMNGALLAKDTVSRGFDFFHPSLAKHFIKSKGIQFKTDLI